MLKTCLIIDDEDQSAEMESLIIQGKRKGIEIECHQFNVGSTFDTSLLTDNKIDIDKVISEYKQRFKQNTFHVAAFDWDLSDENINGVELLRQFVAHGVLKYTPKLLYTGLLDEILLSFFKDIREGDGKNKMAVIRQLKILIKSGIRDFVGREKYEQHILQILESIDESLDLIIENELKKFPDLRFKNSFTSEYFRGKTYAEIANILDDNGLLRNGFKREVIQQVIAYLTEKI